MGITHQDLLVVGSQLAAGGTEAESRSAVSRAYYAAYHFSLQWERRLPIIGSNSGPAGGAHQQLLNRLQNPAPECSLDEKKKSRVLKLRLELLRTKRHAADYVLDHGRFDATSAGQACSDARLICSI